MNLGMAFHMSSADDRSESIQLRSQLLDKHRELCAKRDEHRKAHDRAA
jgi:hypothetical protein